MKRPIKTTLLLALLGLAVLTTTVALSDGMGGPTQVIPGDGRVVGDFNIGMGGLDFAMILPEQGSICWAGTGLSNCNFGGVYVYGESEFDATPIVELGFGSDIVTGQTIDGWQFLFGAPTDSADTLLRVAHPTEQFFRIGGDGRIEFSDAGASSVDLISRGGGSERMRFNSVSEVIFATGGVQRVGFSSVGMSIGGGTGIGSDTIGIPFVFNGAGSGDNNTPLFRLLDDGVRPACSASFRGGVWYEDGGAGVADVESRCMKDSLDAYVWVTVVAAP